MKRDEYIVRLAEALRFLPEDAQKSALAFYTEMLDDRMEDGMDEESAVRAMESPQEIARRLRQENPAAEREAEDDPALEDERMEFSSLVNQVLRTVEAATSHIPETVDEMVRKVKEEIPPEKGDIVILADTEQAEDDSKDADKQGKAYGDYERKTLSCDAALLRAIRLTAAEMPVAVSAAAGDKATLVYYSSPWDPYQAQVENGVMTLERLDQERRHRGFSFSFFSDHLHMMWGRSSPTIELHLPPKILADLSVHTSNGSIKAQDLSALCDVDLHTSNSRIVLRNIRCKSLEMKTSNARLALENVESKQFLRGKTNNSRIEGIGLRCQEDMTLITSNARIVAEGLSAGQGIHLKTSNGLLSVDRLAAPALTLKTSNGTIRGALPGRQQDWAIDSGTSNGHNSLPAFQPGDHPLSAHTSNGSIELRFEQEG